jgi:two-component system cell cycle response regulator
VLIVEDDRDQAEALQDVLTEEGYSVLTAPDGAAGLRVVHQSPPDLVLMDVDMPVLDGTSAALQIRQDPVACNVPVIFVSGSADLVPRIRSLHLPEMDFIQKPYSIEQLLLRMQMSFERVGVQDRLREDAHVDELTGLGNLRLLRERLAMEEARLERYGIPATMIVVDVDKLKAINDQFGHEAGSEALKAVADVLASEIRDTDLAVRYGGDEFVLLLPHTSLTEGMVLADRVLRRIRTLRPSGIQVTVSLGVAARDEKAKGSFVALLAQADAAVYQAKHRGGDQACRHEDAPA